MGYVIAFLFLLLYILFIHQALWRALRGNSKIREGMRAVANSYKGFFRPGGMWKPASLMFRYVGGARVQVTYRKDARRGPDRFFEMIVDWTDGPPFWIADLEHAGRISERARRLGPVVANDRDFVLRGDEQRVAGLMTDGVRWALIQLRKMGPTHDVEVAVERGFFYVRKDGPFRESSAVRTFVDLGLALFEQVKVTQCRGIDFVTSAGVVVQDAKCGVCHAEVVSDMVICVKCKTPHHLDCWQYVGKCSVFGCGELTCRFPGALHRS